MRHILHDWGDEEAREILRACRAAMSAAVSPVGLKAQRLLIVERIRSEKGSDPLSAFTDLEMMVFMKGGKERTEKEFRALLSKAAFKVERVVGLKVDRTLIEATPI